MMHCQLLVPGLLFHASGAEPCRDLPLPVLERLLATGTRTWLPGRSMEAWLMERFGLSKGSQPVAPLTLLADGMAPGNHYWLRADPVHLKVAGDRLVLVDAAGFGIAREEAAALAETLNADFASGQTRLFALNPARWHLRVPAAPQIETTPLPEVRARSIHDLLPRGRDGAGWRSRLNEIQMLLHEHPVNRAREERGALPVNAIWLWGGGALPHDLHNPFTTIWAEDALARGLAQACGASAQPLPEDAGQCLAMIDRPGEYLVVLTQLCASAAYGDIAAWRGAVARLEYAWFAPLARWLKLGRQRQLSIYAVDRIRSFQVSVKRADTWKFWHRPRPLAEICSAAAHAALGGSGRVWRKS
jgi:hypothetical protein